MAVRFPAARLSLKMVPGVADSKLGGGAYHGSSLGGIGAGPPVPKPAKTSRSAAPRIAEEYKKIRCEMPLSSQLGECRHYKPRRSIGPRKLHRVRVITRDQHVWRNSVTGMIAAGV